MVYLVYLLALIFIVLGFLFGVSVGWKCVHGKNSVFLIKTSFKKGKEPLTYGTE